jgi:histone H2A
MCLAAVAFGSGPGPRKKKKHVCGGMVMSHSTSAKKKNRTYKLSEMSGKSGKGGGGGKGGAGKSTKKAKVSDSKRAGLTFPVGRVRSAIKSKIGKMRLQKSAPVFMAAVMEYLAAEILELSGNALRDIQINHANKTTRIMNKHVPMAIYNDSELNTAFRDFIFEGAPPSSEARDILKRLVNAQKDKKKKKKSAA